MHATGTRMCLCRPSGGVGDRSRGHGPPVDGEPRARAATRAHEEDSVTDGLPVRGEDTSPLKGEPTNADELAPQEHQPDPPEDGNRQPRQPGAVEDEPGGDL